LQKIHLVQILITLFSTKLVIFTYSATIKKLLNLIIKLELLTYTKLKINFKLF